MVLGQKPPMPGLSQLKRSENESDNHPTGTQGFPLSCIVDMSQQETLAMTPVLPADNWRLLGLGILVGLEGSPSCCVPARTFNGNVRSKELYPGMTDSALFKFASSPHGCAAVCCHARHSGGS